ncbi:MAG: hypothetical protein RDU89_07915 [bacterium]|nr:hypothetical protein [bacterium]
MMRWTARLVISGLKSDARWLVPIAITVSFALATVVPVQALRDAATGFDRYTAGVLGADLRVNVGASPGADQTGLLVASIRDMGAEVSWIVEMGAPVSSESREAAVRAVVVLEGQYPLYGGELWSRHPGEALRHGVALSINACRALGVAEGDIVTAFGRALPVAAGFPENLLTLASSGDAGTMVVSGEMLSPEAASLLRMGGGILAVGLPSDVDASDMIQKVLVEAFGRENILLRQDVAPVIEVGMTRLKQVFLWCALLIIFICSFGLAFGVEDYANSKADEIAMLKVLGFATPLVGLVVVLRLVIAGLAGGVLATGLGSLMNRATMTAAGTRAADIADLMKLSGFPLEFLAFSTLAILAFGGFPLLVRLAERPHRVLWSKMRGFPLEARTRAGVGSLVSTLVMAVPVMLGLTRWYAGPADTAAFGSVLVLGAGLLVLLVVVIVLKLIGLVGNQLPVSLRWPFTYLRTGVGRIIASTTAVAFALVVGTGALVLDKTINWELQAAVRKQVPFSVCVLAEHGSLSPSVERGIAEQISVMEGVDYSAYCDVGYAFFGPSATQLRPRAVLIKAVEIEDCALFGSILADNMPAAVDPDVVPCSLWEENTRSKATGRRLTLALGSSWTSGPHGDPFEAVVVGVDPRPGLRVGLNAPLTVPAGTLDIPAIRFLGVRADPAFTPSVTTALKSFWPEAEVHDFGAIEVMLRSAAEELAFLWWATALFALMVSVVIFITTSSVARIVRSFSLALLRVLGITGWRLVMGPYFEALTQGVVSGLVAGCIAHVLVSRGFALFFAVSLPSNWVAPALAVAVSVTISLVLQIWFLRRDLRRAPLEVLRSE